MGCVYDGIKDDDNADGGSNVVINIAVIDYNCCNVMSNYHNQRNINIYYDDGFTKSDEKDQGKVVSCGREIGD